MNALLKSSVVLLSASIAVVAAALPATAAAGSPLPPNNACTNPVLAQDATGWSVHSGGTGSRVAITGHPTAHYAYRDATTSTTSVMKLPAGTVSAGQKLTFAADSQISSNGKVRMAVSFYDGSNHKVDHFSGAAANAGPATWSRTSLAATVPSGAVRAVVSQTATLTTGALWLSTACNYLPTTTLPPTSSPTTTTTCSTTTKPPTTTTTTKPPTTTTTTKPPTTTTTTPPTTTTPSNPTDGTQAATVLGWGTRIDGDEFEGTKLDTSKWAAYDGPGNGGDGLRRPSQIAVANGMMTMTGTANGTTGGMSFNTSRLYGRWETRMQVPKGDKRYHPVLILWPTAEDWPKGGEVDYAETTSASTSVDFYLHYGSSNSQTQAEKKLDITQWHNYAVEWTSTGIRGYIDGVLFFTDTTKSHLPPRQMQETIQLDWFPSGSSPATPSKMNVAWTRYYAL